MNIFEYYEDDGSTMDYKEGSFYKRKIIFDPEKKQLEFSAAEGSFESIFKNIKCIFHGFDDMEEVSVNEEKAEIHGQIVKLLDGIRYLEDIYDPGYFKRLREEEKRMGQISLVFKNTLEDIIINWKE